MRTELKKKNVPETSFEMVNTKTIIYRMKIKRIKSACTSATGSIKHNKWYLVFFFFQTCTCIKTVVELKSNEVTSIQYLQ